MKLAIFSVLMFALIASSADAKSLKKHATPVQPADRYFDAAHGANDPYSLWLAGDYVGRDPDLSILGAMKRTPYN
jgi:hypothetical protein